MPTLQQLIQQAMQMMAEKADLFVEALNVFKGESDRHEATRQDLITSVNNKENEIEERFVEEQGKLQVLGNGNGITGQTAFNIFGGRINRSSGNVAGHGSFSNPNFVRDEGIEGVAYLHLVVGEIAYPKSVMSLWEVRGYNYGNNVVNKASVSAYFYSSGTADELVVHHQKHIDDSGLEPFCYVNSDGKATVRLKLAGQYYNQIIFDLTSQSTTNPLDYNFTSGRITSLDIEEI